MENDVYEDLIGVMVGQDIKVFGGESANKFRQLFAQVQQYLVQITAKTLGIKNLSEELHRIALPIIERQTNNIIYSLAEQCSQAINQIMKRLEYIGTLVQKSRKEQDEPQTRSKTNRKNSLLKKVLKIIRWTKQIQELYFNKSECILARRIKFQFSFLTQEEAYGIASKGNGFQKLLEDRTLGKDPLILKQREDDIKKKHQRKRKLAASYSSIIRRISLMAPQQKETDSIWDQMKGVKDYKPKTPVVDQTKQRQRVRKNQQCRMETQMRQLKLNVSDQMQEKLLSKSDQTQNRTVTLHQERQLCQKIRQKMCCILLIGLVILALIAILIVTKTLLSD